MSLPGARLVPLTQVPLDVVSPRDQSRRRKLMAKARLLKKFRKTATRPRTYYIQTNLTQRDKHPGRRCAWVALVVSSHMGRFHPRGNAPFHTLRAIDRPGIARRN